MTECTWEPEGNLYCPHQVKIFELSRDAEVITNATKINDKVTYHVK